MTRARTRHPPSRRRAATVALAFWLVSSVAVSQVHAEVPPRVVVLVGQRTQPYEDVLEGFRAGIAGDGLALTIQVHRLDGERPTPELLQQLDNDQPALVVTIGSETTRSVIEAALEVPQVAGLIADEGDLAGANNATGVLLRFPFEARLRALARALPGCNTIGIVYDATRSDTIRAARRAATQLGMRLEARPVRSAREIPAALSSLSNTACAVLGVADPLVLTRQTAKAFLLFSFRHRLPFIGPSESWVKAGALAALAWRYDDIGLQLATLTRRVLEGERPADILPTVPRMAPLVVNKKTAHHMKIELTDEVLEEAIRVY